MAFTSLITLDMVTLFFVVDSIWLACERFFVD